jgi:hypothetical protein
MTQKQTSENIEKFFSTQENNCEEFLLAQNEKESIDFWRFRESLTEAQKIDGKLIGFDISVPINNMQIFLFRIKKKNRKISTKNQISYFWSLRRLQYSF